MGEGIVLLPCFPCSCIAMRAVIHARHAGKMGFAEMQDSAKRDLVVFGKKPCARWN